MRILVYPHDLTIGGSQINAIDLAAGAAAAGHDVMVYGIHGPLVDYIQERGLRYIPARRLRYRPAASRIAQLAWIAAKERIDLIHGYEWPACLDSYYGAALLLNVPVLCTVLSMSVMPYVPPSIPLIMGTADLGDQARKIQRVGVWVIEPPIDTEHDHPSIDGAEFRRKHEIGEKELLIVSVSRLAADLKLDALVRAVDAVDALAARYPVKLALVGGGPAHDALLTRAQAVNARWSRQVVILTGPLLDPRSAYAAADIVVGMGSSALRALAIGRPVVVQGEKAFSLTFGPETLDVFLRQGFYGLADGVSNVTRLLKQLEALIVSPELRRNLGSFGRKVVVERFSLTRALQLQFEIYREVLANPPRRNLADAAVTAYRALKLEFDNHNPRRKREQGARESLLLTAARQGYWPPASEGASAEGEAGPILRSFS